MAANNLLDDIDVELHHFNQLYSSDNCAYYSFENVNKLKKCDKVDFSVLNCNIRSLAANYDTLVSELDLANFKFDVLCLTETWLTFDTKDIFQINGYQSYHNIRNDGRCGGGVAVIVQDSFECSPLTEISRSTPDIECLFIEIVRGKTKILLATVYRPPNSCHRSFLEIFEESLNSVVIQSYCEVLICGDFNYNLFLSENINVMNFLNCFSSYSLMPLITNATHVTDNSCTLIDNIFTTKSIESCF